MNLYKPKVAVIIPTLNEGKTIGGLIKSLVKNQYPNKEIIVMDGGSTDSTVEIASNLGANVLKERGKTKCPANARNQGACAADADVLCFLDGDAIRVNKNFIENAAKYFRDKNVVGVKVKFKNVGDTFAEKILKRSTNFGSKILEKVHHHGSKFSGRARIEVGANFLRKDTFLLVGGFPTIGVKDDFLIRERLREYLKENEGKKILYQPESILFFRFVYSFGKFFKQCVWYGRTRIPYLKVAGLSASTLVFLLTPLVYLISLISIPLVLVSPWFLIPAIPYLAKFFLLVFTFIMERDVYYLLVPLVDAVYSIGSTIGLLSYALGNKSLSRG